MLSPQLRRKVHDLWSLFWSSGLSNPLVAIEQITYLFGGTRKHRFLQICRQSKQASAV